MSEGAFRCRIKLAKAGTTFLKGTRGLKRDRHLLPVFPLPDYDQVHCHADANCRQEECQNYSVS